MPEKILALHMGYFKDSVTKEASTDVHVVSKTTECLIQQRNNTA